MRRRATLALLIVSLLSFCDGYSMNTELRQLIANKDFSAVDVARGAGPAAVTDVEPYLANADPAVRVLAVDCLAAAGGPAATDLLIRAFADGNEQVRINAINALRASPPKGRESALLNAWEADKTRDGFVRQQIPMILGSLSARTTTAELRRFLGLEQRQDVRDGMIAGLAKLGDALARNELGQLLRDARGKRTAELMDYVAYLDDRWVLPLLVPVLQRRELAIDLSTHRNTIRRRECDLAVDAVLKISKAQFTFQLDELAQYTDEQIAEALRYAQSLPQP
jgi:hypothetical protein